MSSKRLYEVAAEYGKPVNEVIELLKKHDVDKKNFSAVDDKVMSIIRDAYEKKNEAPKIVKEEKRQQAPSMVVKNAVGTKPAAVVQSKRVMPQSQRLEVRQQNQGRTIQQQPTSQQSTRNVQSGQRSDMRQQNFNRVSQQSQRNNQSQGTRGDVRQMGQPRGTQQAQRPMQRAQQGQRGAQQNAASTQRSGSQPSRDNRQAGRNGGQQRQGGIFVGPRGQQSGGTMMHGESRAQNSNQRYTVNRNENRDNYQNNPKNGGAGGKGRKEKPQLKGSYATKESRPNRSAGHQMPLNKTRKPQDAAKHARPAVEVVRPTYVEVGETINVQEFAKLIKREVNEIIKSLFMLGMMVTINQDIDFDTAQLLGTEFGVDIGKKAAPEDPTEIPEVDDPPEKRVLRPPVITVMGHVDHGKTSLLDAIRKTNVTAREAGGITQHIGAYKVNYQGKQIVFLDTPGHEAFTAMRARGAQVTDVAILVVAADDGVMPQTIEAINHAKAAKVPIIVAINKMDRVGANPDHVKQQLSEQGLIPEDWGGDTIMVPVSAHQKTGITDLLEMILLVAEMQELKANPLLPAHGTIIEAQLDKGRGPVATVLVQRGTLHVGDTIIAGTCYGKVRAMANDRGEKVKKALPSTPVEVLGLNDVPQAGDILDCTEEKIARSVAEKRIAKKKEEEVKLNTKVSLDDLFQRIQEGEIKELNLVVKADVQGTIEALKASLEKIKNEEVKVVVVHAGVGAITETDIMLASAANALIIGFNVRPDANARKAAEAEKVDLRTYRVIYDAINDVEAAIKGMLAPKFKEVVQGRVEVRQLITISKLLVAGCYVAEGKVTNSSKVRIVRDGIVISEDVVDSLRRFKDDVKEVAQGFECGITLEKYRDIKEGDIFEVYNMEEITVE